MLTQSPVRMHSPKVLWYAMPMFGTYMAQISESQAAPASATCPATNEAQYYPFVIPARKMYTHGWWYNGTAPAGTTNVSMAIYDAAQTRLNTTGNVALGTASVLQTAAFAAGVTCEADTIYYYSIEYTDGADANAVAAYSASLSRGKLAGFYRQAVGANPLPATAAFATWTSQVVPVCGIADFAIV